MPVFGWDLLMLAVFFFLSLRYYGRLVARSGFMSLTSFAHALGIALLSCPVGCSRHSAGPRTASERNVKLNRRDPRERQ